MEQPSDEHPTTTGPPLSPTNTLQLVSHNHEQQLQAPPVVSAITTTTTVVVTGVSSSPPAPSPPPQSPPGSPTPAPISAGGAEVASTSRWSGGEGSATRRVSVGGGESYRQGGVAGDSAAVAPLPESVVEAVALECAVACANTQACPLAAGRALACIFQVCSTWRSVSRSELLWENVFKQVWPLQARQPGRSWHHSYVRAHLTASNIRSGRRYTHTLLSYQPSAPNDVCRCLAISSRHLAAGFFDGTVRLFDLNTKSCIRALKPEREDRFGPLSRAIAGISLHPDRVVFASLDGSVFLASISSSSSSSLVTVHVGNVIEDGALISFAGSASWWIGLYAGSVGRSFRVWDSRSREIIYSGGTAMNNDAMRGWQSFVQQAGQIGRVRVSNDELLVTATRSVISVHEISAAGLVPLMQRTESNAVEAVDVKGDKVLSSSYEGFAAVRSLPTMEEICRVRVGGGGGDGGGGGGDEHQPVAQQLFGTLNSRQLFLCIAGSVNAWDVSSGEHLYSLRERLQGDVYDLVASDSHLAACVADSGLHLWDFSPVDME